MAFAIALSDKQWELVAELFDPPGRRGPRAVIPRRQLVEAMLFIGRTGRQWRYLLELRSVDGLGPMAALAGVGCLGGRDDPPGRDRPGPPRSRTLPVDHG